MDTDILTGIHLLEAGDRYGYTPDLIACARRYGFVDQSLSMEDDDPQSAHAQIKSTLMQKIKTMLNSVWTSVRTASTKILDGISEKWNTVVHKPIDQKKLDTKVFIESDDAFALIETADNANTMLGKIMTFIRTGMIKSKAGMAQLSAYIKTQTHKLKGKFHKPPEDVYDTVAGGGWNELDFSEPPEKKTHWTIAQISRLKGGISSFFGKFRATLSKEPSGSANPLPFDPSTVSSVGLAEVVHYTVKAIRFCLWLIKEVIETALSLVLAIIIGVAM